MLTMLTMLHVDNRVETEGQAAINPLDNRACGIIARNNGPLGLDDFITQKCMHP